MSALEGIHQGIEKDAISGLVTAPRDAVSIHTTALIGRELKSVRPP